MFMEVNAMKSISLNRSKSKGKWIKLNTQHNIEFSNEKTKNIQIKND